MFRIIATLAMFGAGGLPVLAQGSTSPADVELAKKVPIEEVQALAEAYTPPDDKALMRSFSVEDMKALVTSEGHTLSPQGAFGPFSIRATTADGLIFDIIGSACATEYSPNCLGLKLQVGYFADDSVSLARINESNLMWPPATTWYDPTQDEEGPTLGITRYVILDRGMTFGNVKDNLINLLAIAPQAANHVFQLDDSGLGAEADDDFYDDEW